MIFPTGQVVGVGVDLVEITRIQRSIEQHAERFLERVFTEQERAYAEDSPKRRYERYAARFAAKEAAFKVLGTGWRSGIGWTDVEVVSAPTGQPSLQVTGEAAKFADQLGIRSWLVSLSHTDSLAIATVLGQVHSSEE